MSERADTGAAKVEPHRGAEEASSYPLAVFRILFGCILTRFFLDIYSSSWAALQFKYSQISLQYDWITWLRPTSDGIDLLLIVLVASAICFTLGLFYRINCILLLVCYSYLYLADPSWASSSRYLIWVLIVLFTLTNAHNTGSVDALFLKRFGLANVTVPDLHLTAFKIIFTLVPFYSGFAKWMSEDWMERAEPLSTLLLFGSVSNSYPAWAFLSGPSYGFSPSALVDLGFLVSYSIVSIEIVGSVSLWHHWTRPLGLFATAFLALLHSSIAQGVYPYITICSFCLWLSPERSRSILNAIGLIASEAKTISKKTSSTTTLAPLTDKKDTIPKTTSKPKKIGASSSSSEGKKKKFGFFVFVQKHISIVAKALLYIFIAQQIITPSLTYLGSHDPSWSVPANSISWRMMIQTQSTLVSWYASKLPNPKSSLPDPGQSYLISHFSEDYSSKRASDETWHAAINSPSLLMQWSKRFVLGTVHETGFRPKHLHVNAYRSVNGRPYQSWFKPERSDVASNALCSNSWPSYLLFWSSCDDIIEPRIEEFNTLDWLFEQQVFSDEWIQKGHETVVFAQRQNSTTFNAAFEPFAEKIQFILLAGSVSLDVQSVEEVIRPSVGEIVNIPWRSYHSVKTISKEPAAWAYVWPWPRNMTIGDSLGM